MQNIIANALVDFMSIPAEQRSTAEQISENIKKGGELSYWVYGLSEALELYIKEMYLRAQPSSDTHPLAMIQYF